MNVGDRDDSDALDRARAVIERRARLIADFPEPGIAFKDLTPVLADPDGLDAVVDALASACSGADLIAGVDARGFLLGGAVARQLGLGVVAVRKGGKLPPPVIGLDYQLEYGTARLEIPEDGIDLADRRVAVLDDVLATGGTAVAAAQLLQRAGARVDTIAVVMELDGLSGRELVAAELGPAVRVHNLCLG
ncbi:adenine phosphoribosyltransferase [Gordonia sp. (in: high G+C Gram-positive bacteria)]|uniref:adenine phosphoribosyltransferase n=1 Tax=Gordonia sp. (in: high G+C Gram-positive bacteria) TaxID=84139 RepID=UPI0016A05F1F|nr:adenine phosphoribosyltransferase [Gordonia sp. (in: high G+C Gram-positive bacteria)]NLG47497.1 adenine phosphoribosyltransferase [Gordonia sp. (in: high G+C Gram-positive bacteria)]